MGLKIFARSKQVETVSFSDIRQVERMGLSPCSPPYASFCSGFSDRKFFRQFRPNQAVSPLCFASVTDTENNPRLWGLCRNRSLIVGYTVSVPPPHLPRTKPTRCTTRLDDSSEVMGKKIEGWDMGLAVSAWGWCVRRWIFGVAQPGCGYTCAKRWVAIRSTAAPTCFVIAALRASRCEAEKGPASLVRMRKVSATIFSEKAGENRVRG